jgi:hypothetical protein
MLRITNPDEIEQIVYIPRSVGQRIKRECQLMHDKYDSLFIEYTLDGNIHIGFTKSRHEYIFHINKNYPFTCPRVTINGLNQYNFFKVPSNRFKTILQYISGLQCLCCDSVLCANNWGPAITLYKIVNQIEEYKKIKLNIQQKILADQIKQKYLNRDIDLDSWLFTISVPRLCLPNKQYH